jgi:DNA-binding GntR family transcriptional regulator
VDSKLKPSSAALLAAVRRQGIRRTSGLPVYMQIAEAFEDALTRAEVPVSSLLPSEHELAQALGVSRPTIRQALGYLEQRSVLYKRRGIGTFRAPDAIARPPRLASVYDELVAQGSAPVTKVLQLAECPAPPAVAEDLHVSVDAPVVWVERLRTVEARPVVLHSTYLNLEGAPPPDRAELEQGSLYALLRVRYGIELTLASQEVTARAATPREREQLELDRRSCVLVAQRVSFDAAGRGIEWAINAYPPGTQSFQMRLSAW